MKQEAETTAVVLSSKLLLRECFPHKSRIAPEAKETYPPQPNKREILFVEYTFIISYGDAYYKWVSKRNKKFRSINGRKSWEGSWNGELENLLDSYHRFSKSTENQRNGNVQS